MEGYHSLVDTLSDTGSNKNVRAKIFRKLARLRKQIFKDNQKWIDEVECKLDSTLDEAKKFELFPYGRDEESFRVMMIALKISVKCKLRLNLPVEKIYYLLKENKEACNTVYAYLDKWQKNKANEFLTCFPVDHQTKVECGQSFPCSPDATRLIMSFLIPREIAKMMVVNHYFYDLCNAPDMWNMYRYYIRESGFKVRSCSSQITAKEFVLKYHSTWHCAFCDEIRSDGETPLFCTSPENKIHTGLYNTWECEHCHQKGFGGNPNEPAPQNTYYHYNISMDQRKWYACPGQQQITEEDYYKGHPKETGNQGNWRCEWRRAWPKRCYDPNFCKQRWVCCDQSDGREEIGHYYRRQYPDYMYSYPMIMGCKPGKCRKNKIPDNVLMYRKYSRFGKRSYI